MFGTKNLIWYKCWFLLHVATLLASQEHKQPNIVFIMADDVGWNDVSYHGSDQIQAPNIDGLALQSAILQQYYSEAICTPARTALLTGKYPMRLVINQHNASRPLFLHISQTAAHAGNSGAALQLPWYKPVGHRHIAHSDRRLYAELMAALDRSVGQIVEALAQGQMLNNTIIVFVSDNGAPTVDFYKNWGSNLPFRGIKRTPWEGAVRVPAFMWHANIRPTLWDGLMHITDWLPTLVSAAGGNIISTIDGINLWDSIVFNYESMRKDVLIAVEDGSDNIYAVYREGDYKIIIGNVTGLRNDYHGAEFMVNREPPPSYYDTLTSSYVARVFASMNISFDSEEVQAVRNATLIQQFDSETDTTLCVPTSNRGCLFNVRLDPMERHDLWDVADETVVMLTNKLNSLWAMQMNRTTWRLCESADPVNFNYAWSPWITNATDFLEQ